MANFRGSLNFRPDGSERDAPLYNGFLFQRNREQDSSTPYPPYPFYSTLPGNQSIPLQFKPQAAAPSFSQLHGCPEPSTSQIPQPKLSQKSEKTRRTSWETIEVRSLIAAYRANYDRLKSTKSSHGKKTVWDSIMDDFLSLCSDAGRESEKTLVQIKEKWRSLFDQFKAAKDHNNKTGRDRKTFEFYDDINKFLSGSDKVNLQFVKETKVKPNVSQTNSDSGNSAELAAADPTTVADGEKANDANDLPCPPKKKTKRSSIEAKEAESTILNLMEAQQAAIEKADEKDERLSEALLKSQSDSPDKTSGIYSFCPRQT
ncbi:PREDICTED: uncharacterized protein LOC107330296 [Acropora digitifera]|uniref:uncharacterized protein LOC107330296 n=1 Tax=Acropora digitifera TaxID=70779 RepID=UPI00077A6699|nr:PREDICTED: uncharacterized protein LOC107330296 [Acropora digitifera]